jgi:multidrug resistance efflux pump
LRQRPLRKWLRKREADYTEAQSEHQGKPSTLPEAESAVSEAKANLDLAEITFRRMQDVYAMRSISNQGIR